MRTTFAQTLLKQMKQNKRIMLLTGDLGYSVFEEIQESCPDQYINCGLIEQTMTGIAAGLASEGYIPFIYSIIPFITMRNFEQIRNDICYQQLPVHLVGVGAGFSYGTYGHTHHALEDISIMRTLPNLTILSPTDSIEVEQLVPQMIESKNSVYMRLGKSGEPRFHSVSDNIVIGSISEIQKGKDVMIFTTSTMLSSVLKTADLLQEHSLSVGVASVHTIKPFDIAFLKKRTSMKCFVSIEEHTRIGGLGSIIAEHLIDHSISVPLLRIGVPDRFTPIQGFQEDMRRANMLSPDHMAHSIEKFIHGGIIDQ